MARVNGNNRGITNVQLQLPTAGNVPSGSILESVLLHTMYDLPSSEGVTKVVIDSSVINGESEPMLMYENVDQAKAAPDD